MRDGAESPDKRAARVKGWCVRGGDVRINDGNVVLKEIRSLVEYMELVLSLNSEKANPVFYRGHFNANYIPVPGVMRNGLVHEDTMIREFSRRFSNEVSGQKTTLEKLALMQHYGLCTRVLDITESPLVALAFACNSYPPSVADKNDDCWGEVALFQENNRNENHMTSDIKYTESQTTSIMANCALCQYEFYLGFLRIFFLQDGQHGHDKDFIKFRDIVSQSVIVRAPLSNERQKNQRGAYILCTANEIIKITKGNSRTKPVAMDTEQFTRKILTPEYDMFSIGDMNRYEEYATLKDSMEWDFLFRKINPYSPENRIEHFQKDPFSLEHLYYTDTEGKRLAVVIPPESKKKIARELEQTGIDNFFLYPEMNNVSGEINKIYAGTLGY